MTVAPLVSVITPSFQAQHYIEKTIETVQRQTYQNWEMLIADDGSTDNTRSLIICAAERDERIHPIFLSENGGAYRARNAALHPAKGRYVAYLDADDLWAPDKLEKQVRFMMEKGYAFSCVSYQVISDEGKPLNKIVRMKPCLDYQGFLLNNLIQNILTHSQADNLGIALSVQGQRVHVTVSDDGVGIDKEDLHRIFDRLYKCDKGRSGKGSGLGLSIVRQLVEKMGGNITADSVVGKGTTFYLSFPLAR